MGLGKDYAGQNCSLARALEVVGERWTLLILRDAFLGVSRFDHFARRLGLAPGVLTRRLALLTDNRILERRAYQHTPLRHEYLLTPRGRDLFPAVMALLHWGDRHLAPGGPPAVVKHRDCGGVVNGRACCDRCGQPVASDQVEWHYGPGSTRGEGLRPVPPP